MENAPGKNDARILVATDSDSDRDSDPDAKHYTDSINNTDAIGYADSERHSDSKRYSNSERDTYSATAGSHNEGITIPVLRIPGHGGSDV
jgi:hypothetical protein